MKYYVLSIALLCSLSSTSVSAQNAACAAAFDAFFATANQTDEWRCKNVSTLRSLVERVGVACARNMSNELAILNADAAKCPKQPGSSSTMNRGAAGAGDRAKDYQRAIEACDSRVGVARQECRRIVTEQYQSGSAIVLPKGSSASRLGQPQPDKDGSTGSTLPAPDDNRTGPPPFTPLNPSADYSGKPCSYFTRAPVEDGVRMNFYASESCVSYGEISYECVSGRWVKKGPEVVFRCPRAEDIEGKAPDQQSGG